MQLTDLIAPIDSLTDDQLRDRLREMRHNRSKAKPATKTREKKEVKKGATQRLDSMEDLFGAMSPEDKAALIAQLKGE